jgi:hypothetical protein
MQAWRRCQSSVRTQAEQKRDAYRVCLIARPGEMHHAVQALQSQQVLGTQPVQVHLL